MDIYSAQSHMNKVNEYLETLKANPRIYNKTKDKLRSLSGELFKGVELISEILMEESLSADYSSFEVDSASDITSSAEDFRKRSETLSSKTVEMNRFVNNSNSTVTSMLSRKVIIAKYANTLKHVSESSNTSYSSVSECATLIYTWFNARFFEAPKHSNNFFYNVKQFKEWIEYIVIGYGAYLQQGRSIEFVVLMNTWCDTLINAPATVPYALPLEIFNLGRSSDKSAVSLTALCLWDMLIDMGLDELTASNLGDSRLSKYAIQDRFSKIDSEMVDSYTYNAEDTLLLREYKIV